MTAVPDFDLWFVWAGRGRMQTDIGDIHLRPGICIWMRPSGFYLADQDPQNHLGVSFIHFDLLDASGDNVGRDVPIPPVVHDVSDVNFVDVTMRRVTELMRHDGRAAPLNLDPHTQQTAAMLLKGLLMDLDAVTERAASVTAAGTKLHHQKLVMEMASRISEMPGDAPPIAQLAEEAGYSSDHFARIFKSVLGQSPQTFIVQAKINRACQLLTESTLTISQIADALRYPDIYFFSKQFKQKKDCTPTTYRLRGRLQ